MRNFGIRLLFFNYIIPPLSKSRKQPNNEQWENHQPLDYRLNELKPDLLVVLGYRMWDWLLKQPPDGIKITKAPTLHGAFRQPSYFHLNNGFKILAYALRHPSSAFSYRNQAPLLSEIIKRA